MYMNLLDRFKSVGSGQITLDLPALAHWRLATVALGIGVAALGQIVIMSSRVFDLPVLTPFADEFFDMFQRPTTVLLGVLLLLVGAVVFAAFIRSESGDDAAERRLGPVNLPFSLPRSLVFAALIVLGVAFSGYLWLQLAGDSFSRGYPVIFALGLALLAGALFFIDKRNGVDFRFRIGLWEFAFVAAVTGGFIAINLSDLTKWYYTGEETYVIYNFSSSIADGITSPNFFSQTGPRPWEPVMQYYYLAAVMKVFGINFFGWKLSSVLAGAAVFPALYFLARTLFNARIAVIATLLLLGAHVLLAYSHYGWASLTGLAPGLTAMALFFAGVKRGSALLLFLAGAVAGVGFYVNMAVRLTMPILAAFVVLLLLFRHRIQLRHTVVFVALGLFVAVAPIFISNGIDVIREPSKESLFNYRHEERITDVWDSVQNNIFVNTTAFNFSHGGYNSQEIYASGSLLEPITAVLAVLGLAYAVRRFRAPAYLFLVTWFVVSMVSGGYNSPHREIAVGRLMYMIPLMVLLAALALDAATGFFQRSVNFRVLRWAAPVAIAVVVFAAFGSNLYRFWEVSPEKVPANPPAVVMKAALSDECRSSDRNTVVVTGQPQGTVFLAINAWDWGSDRVPVIVGYDDIEMVNEFAPVSCVVYQPGRDRPVDQDVAQLRRQTGAQTVTTEFDRSGQRSVLVLK